ncbi:MAG: hypothetical protein IJN69_01175 [Oscillospiraceae bacterium]|nr:hypothetical protein [Oscillospiraceae bacterium]
MKNSFMYTALAAFVAFIGAAVYAMLFLMELLPSGFLFALTGIAIAIIVLVLLTFSAAYCGCKAKHCLHNSLACFGKALIFAAVAALCISVLLLTLTSSVTPFYAAILFLTVFFWKFLLIIWGFSLAVAIPCYCYIDNVCSADTAAIENSCSTSNNYRSLQNNCNASSYTNSRYNY